MSWEPGCDMQTKLIFYAPEALPLPHEARRQPWCGALKRSERENLSRWQEAR